MKTYDEWVALVKDEELKQELIEVKEFKFRNTKHLYKSINAAIERLFTWEDTPQGHDYWQSIYESEIELIPDNSTLPQSSDELKQFIKDTVEAFYPQLKKS